MVNTIYKIATIFFLVCSLMACDNSHGIKLHDQKGKSYDLEKLKGKYVIINYWASWCKPCYKEIPALNEFNRKHEDILVLGVNYDQASGRALKKIISRMGIEFPVLREDPANILSFGNVPGLPATYVLGKDGKLKQRLLGEQTVATLEVAIE